MARIQCLQVAVLVVAQTVAVEIPQQKVVVDFAAITTQEHHCRHVVVHNEVLERVLVDPALNGDVLVLVDLKDSKNAALIILEPAARLLTWQLLSDQSHAEVATVNRAMCVADLHASKIIVFHVFHLGFLLLTTQVAQINIDRHHLAVAEQLSLLVVQGHQQD